MMSVELQCQLSYQRIIKVILQNHFCCSLMPIPSQSACQAIPLDYCKREVSEGFGTTFAIIVDFFFLPHTCTLHHNQPLHLTIIINIECLVQCFTTHMSLISLYGQHSKSF